MKILNQCILNMLRYVHSLKVISNICEIRTMKANSVRILCAQSLVNIMSFYDIGLIIKAKSMNPLFLIDEIDKMEK